MKVNNKQNENMKTYKELKAEAAAVAVRWEAAGSPRSGAIFAELCAAEGAAADMHPEAVAARENHARMMAKPSRPAGMSQSMRQQMIRDEQA